MVFNDFVVTSVSERDALGFPGIWKVCNLDFMLTCIYNYEHVSKVPAILYYERTDMREKLNLKDLPQELDLSILRRDINIAM